MHACVPFFLAVHDVAVMPELQGLGLGRQLLERLTRALYTRDVTDVGLMAPPPCQVGGWELRCPQKAVLARCSCAAWLHAQRWASSLPPCLPAGVRCCLQLWGRHGGLGPHAAAG